MPEIVHPSIPVSSPLQGIGQGEGSDRFSQRLRESVVRPILTDGSIVATLAAQGLTDPLPERYNLTQPIAVEHVHRAFAEAGAELLVSNTERANAITLARHHLAEKAYEINRKGVWLARTAASDHELLVAAAMGPVGKFLSPIGPLKREDVRQAFHEQALALLDGGPDVFMLRSFIDMDELEIAIEEVQRVAPHIPIIAQKTFPEDGALLATDFAHKVARRLIAHGVAAIGSNGTVGPNRMLSIIQALAVPGIAISAQPDIGIPTLADGRPVYHATPEYIGESARRLVEAGASIVGAAGGARPEHIRAIHDAIHGLSAGEIKVHEAHVNAEQHNGKADQTKFSQFKQNLGKKFLATVELDVPRGLDMSSVFEGASFLAKAGMDAVNISDGARARLRMSSFTIGHMVQTQCGIEAMTHLACRDRNMVGLQSELLGAEALGVRNILCVTGDPAQIGDYPYATSVYDIDAIGLIRAVHSMNEGCDLLGNSISGGAANCTHFLIACGCNPVADDMDRELARLERKIAEGCEVIFTQPLFEMKALAPFLDAIKTFPGKAKIMLGIMPLRSIRHAEFLHYEVPGMSVPQWIRDRIAARSTVDAQSKEGVEICVEFLKEARAHVDGVYMMPPFRRYQMAVDILERLG
ncbi:MAG: bifunctional homocysteine S-methyltransferase/methylenetetrahydrofolate reductase [Bacteroidota bacterium]|nr:bifunctional homocysteine S-methyltransferase/methylenetetrahydrofolate reductase [Bacteroidota bacterium]MDP4232487.1 bifunctional homocysteine S-methyltransferase/methylenetetrahydrofolate reductase [Bacteroidota bacterium]MDP4241622.1 bifunctional homocysteine S-methyltransferase/methylenetetrahydrofolate reductase [Bacteroidota bacterium]MDP4286366.1 bifunctional homocysteine S-methyltransferase/methylenetetrahydrofolate reductase [Bacteroidota bacterium]